MKTDTSLLRLFASMLLLLLWILPISAKGQWKENFHIRGYIQGAPVRIAAELPEPIGEDHWMEYRIQNRLNLRWSISREFSFHWQMRTRLFAGDLVRDIPGYAQGIDYDDGWINLSWLVIDRDDWILHYIPDRLYGEWNQGSWNVRLGRQRVNWGVNLITNPNDIFNIYSIYDFDYPERPGSDALRIQRFLGFGSRLELAASPAGKLENSVVAALYSFHTGGYDVQLVGGYYRQRWTAGGGWAGNLGGAGLKGEAMFFSSGSGPDGSMDANVILAASLDYMLQGGLFLVAEGLFNKQGGRDEFRLMAEQLTPDNPSFSTWQMTIQGSYPVHPLLDAGLAAIVYPDEMALFVSPSITWSVLQDLDFQMLMQFFAGSDDSVFAQAGNILTASLKYNL